MLNLHSALYGKNKKREREKLLFTLHTNSSFEGTIESLRDVLCFKHTPKNDWPQSHSYCYSICFFFLKHDVEKIKLCV